MLVALSLGVLVLFMHRRHDVLHDIGLSRAELVLLTAGPIAGLFVNIPIAQHDNGLLSINLGGALIPLLIVALWVKRGRLDPVLAVLGTLAVSVVAKSIVVFDPEQGIFTGFPEMFAPSLVAVVFAVAMSATRPLRAAPLAYTAGSMGSLLGADLWNLGPILDHLGGSPELRTLSIGGAGVFDMVYLAGILAMAGALPLVAVRAPRQRKLESYPPRLPRAADPSIVVQRALLLRDPNPRERARVALARSDVALQEQRWADAIAEAWQAVDGLAAAEPYRLAQLRGEGPGAFRSDAAALDDAHLVAATGQADRALAGNANHAAKLLVRALEREAPMTSRLARGLPLQEAR